jgi:hypothetical protein
MTNDRRTMYNRFSDKGAHSIERVQITNDFLNLAFAGGHHVAKLLRKKCWNYRFLSRDDIHLHLCKVGFMLNYLVWCEHREVQPAATTESDGNEDENQMDDMITNIGRE